MKKRLSKKLDHFSSKLKFYNVQVNINLNKNRKINVPKQNSKNKW